MTAMPCDTVALPSGWQPVGMRCILISEILAGGGESMAPRSNEMGKPIPHVTDQEIQAQSWHDTSQTMEPGLKLLLVEIYANDVSFLLPQATSRRLLSLSFSYIFLLKKKQKTSQSFRAYTTVRWTYQYKQSQPYKPIKMGSFQCHLRDHLKHVCRQRRTISLSLSGDCISTPHRLISRPASNNIVPCLWMRLARCFLWVTRSPCGWGPRGDSLPIRSPMESLEMPLPSLMLEITVSVACR